MTVVVTHGGCSSSSSCSGGQCAADSWSGCCDVVVAGVRGGSPPRTRWEGPHTWTMLYSLYILYIYIKDIARALRSRRGRGGGGGKRARDSDVSFFVLKKKERGPNARRMTFPFRRAEWDSPRWYYIGREWPSRAASLPPSNSSSLFLSHYFLYFDADDAPKFSFIYIHICVRVLALANKYVCARARAHDRARWCMGVRACVCVR